MQDLQIEIEKIKERNIKVEQDKAWEVSWTRRIFIALITYIVAIIWLYLINETLVFLKSAVPVLGYLISTLSLPVLKKHWLNK